MFARNEFDCCIRWWYDELINNIDVCDHTCNDDGASCNQDRSLSSGGISKPESRFSRITNDKIGEVNLTDVLSIDSDWRQGNDEALEVGPYDWIEEWIGQAVIPRSKAWNLSRCEILDSKPISGISMDQVVLRLQQSHP